MLNSTLSTANPEANRGSSAILKEQTLQLVPSKPGSAKLVHSKLIRSKLVQSRLFQSKLVPSKPTEANSVQPELHAQSAGVDENAVPSASEDGDGSNEKNKQVAGMLSTWKDISAYLGRGVRTVQRWENNLGLPVHRIGTGNRPPVFAFEHEIEEWLRRTAGVEMDSEEPTQGEHDRSDSNPEGLDFAGSNQQWIAEFLQELRMNALELERDLAGEGSVPNVSLAKTLRSIQELANAAVARSQFKAIAQSD